jgi:hypothetical protein
MPNDENEEAGNRRYINNRHLEGSEESDEADTNQASACLGKREASLI